jgi:general secretion pathway protein F
MSHPAGSRVGEERRFSYRAVKPDGEVVSDVVRARDRREALARVAQHNLIVTDIREAERAPAFGGGAGAATPKLAERVLVLKQLATMVRAGVELLEALETIAHSLGAGPMPDALREAAAGLRRGDRIADALSRGMPFYPPYVFALVSAGEASGRLDRVLEEAASQLAFEDRIRRDISGALAYPAFLVASGMLTVGFLFYAVVPRFAAMVNAQRAEIDALPRFILGLGQGFHDNVWLVLGLILAAGFSLYAFARSAAGVRAIATLLESAPVTGPLIGARQRAGWSRIMAFALSSGVGIMEAASLAEAAAPVGRFHDGVADASRALRAGKTVDEAFGASGALAPIDLSLLRVGQRSGALADMFRAVADRYEEDLRDGLKRATALVEPVSIGLVALAVATVVLSLVTAMTSIYDAIG